RRGHPVAGRGTPAAQSVQANNAGIVGLAGRDLHQTVNQNVTNNFAEPGPSPRVLITRDVAFLTGIYGDHTTIEATRLIEPYQGHWMRMKATVSDIYQSGGQMVMHCVRLDGSRHDYPALFARFS